MKLHLVLGCWGREHEGFTVCHGAQNKVLDLTAQTERNTAIADHLDSHCYLYDRPLYRNVHTALYTLQGKFSENGKPIFNKTLFKLIEHFCLMHAKCGTFLRLEMKETE